MAITNPEAILFCNEDVRVICEQTRALKARINDASVKWFGGVNTLFPNDSSLVDDKRDAEGVSRLTGADVNSVMSVLIAAGNDINDQIIQKPCVRPLQVG